MPSRLDHQSFYYKTVRSSGTGDQDALICKVGADIIK
jgi:hypothetical protein